MSAQAMEGLIRDGEKGYMSCIPGIPENNSRITEVEWRDIPNFEYGTTACRRRYHGTWEIKDNKLFLVDVEGKYIMSPGEPIFADWVNDTIIIKQGELLSYLHIGFGSIYERELRITIVDGIVTGSETVEALDDPMYKEYLDMLKEKGIDSIYD